MAQSTSGAPPTQDWGSTPNPGQDEVRRAHIEAVFKVAVKTLTRCPDCSAYLTEATTHSGARIHVETTAYERFVVVDGKLHVAAGYVLRDHAHRCNPTNHVMDEARAEFEQTKNLETDAEWDAYGQEKLRARQERWNAFGDVPNPIGGARAAR